MRRTIGAVAAAVVALALLAGASVAWLNVRGEDPIVETPAAAVATTATIERGAYLARAGNCAACHTERGGLAYAGGRGIDTPFGTVYSGNLTPDAKTGIGTWSSSEFWRAMHNGRAKDGRLLYPAFPYPNYTQVTREDSDAIFAFLRTQAPVKRANRPHDLRFPYGTQPALAVWRALFFKPDPFEARHDKTAEWNRGAYLVRGLGHCIACHSERNALGATSGSLELAGGLIPVQNWYAPSLASSTEAGVAGWDVQHIVDLLATGTSAQGSAIGPMAEVVYRSTQHLAEDDLRAMAVFLRELPQEELPQETADAVPMHAPDPSVMKRGAKIYEDQCAKCHGDQGQGAPRSYPPLNGSRKVLMASSVNLVQVVVNGGFPATTAGNPRPFGMPPFGQSLDNAEVAAVITYVRNAWGNQASPVSELDVFRAR
jgi:mono/diheme cytochrome c family protein